MSFCGVFVPPPFPRDGLVAPALAGSGVPSAASREAVSVNGRGPATLTVGHKRRGVRRGLMSGLA
jgi:hypothetical protein